MRLTDEEALAIRWHMGAYDDAARGGSRTLSAAMAVSPLVVDLVLILQGRTPLVDLHLLSLRFLFHSFVVIAARERL